MTLTNGRHRRAAGRLGRYANARHRRLTAEGAECRGRSDRGVQIEAHRARSVSSALLPVRGGQWLTSGSKRWRAPSRVIPSWAPITPRTARHDVRRGRRPRSGLLLRVQPTQLHAANNRDTAISIQPELISSKIFPHPVFADVPSRSKSQPTAKRLRASSQRSRRHPARRLPGRRLRRLREQHDDHVAVIERMRTHSCGESIGAMSVERVTAGVVRLPDL